MPTLQAIAGGFIILIGAAFIIYIFGLADQSAYNQGTNLMGSAVYSTPEYSTMSLVIGFLAVIVAFVALLFAMSYARRDGNNA